MDEKRVIETDLAPPAVGPYSQAIVAGGFVFLSGQVPLDPATGRLIESEDVGDHVARCFENLKAVLEAAGSDLDRAVKVTLYLADIHDYRAANEAYARYFGEAPPARAAFQVARLPLNARVEIDMIALA
ncbi:MAG: RidA family protein [Myxococcales bacterium]|nr:RidA family protein [Myxococcales bacterium]